MEKPLSNEYSKGIYTSFYIEQVDSQNVIESLIKQKKITKKIFEGVKNENKDFKYASNKWSIIEVMGHILDTERIFAYRALALARGESQILLGFDQDDYVKEANFTKRSIESILEEYCLVRDMTILFFKGLTKKEAEKIGKVGNNIVSVRALAWMIAGHELHHLKVLKEKYLIG